jgi:N-acyl-D-aspartate/D-glutamate deacylase
VSLAGVLAEHPGTTISLILAGSISGFSDDEIDLLTDMSVAADRPINWNVLGVSAAAPDSYKHQLSASDRAAARGGRVFALTLPHQMQMRLSFRTGFLLDGLPGWREVMHLPVPERLAALADPEVRKRLDEGAHSDEAGMLRAVANWKRMIIAEVFSDVNGGAEGRTVGEIANQRGGAPFDVLCDIVIADELRTGLDPQLMRSTDEDFRVRADVWRDPRTVIGGSDAGAHLDMMCGAIASTSLLAEGVRDHGVITLEEAVRQLTDVPARLYGLRNRGRIAEGWSADLVLFDPDTVGWLPIRTRFDLPGGAPRLYSEAEGITSVWVNGTAIVEDGAFTGATPGTLLHSGRDTETVTAS